ncbi:MAG: ADP-ribosylglycohydrolase family protein [Anaerolineae bacterium]
MPETTLHRIPPDYGERVYAGWLGKCIGVRFGAPIENWTYEEIRDNLGDLEDCFPLPGGKIFKPDDDTSLPVILLRAVQDYGPEVSAGHIGETWLNYLADQRGTLWWGGYGVSSEHTAYVNLKYGIPAPLSGSIELNGEGLAEQIGGQIFSDIWGLLCPNNPALAAEYAAKASSVSHDRNGVYGGMFIAALVSTAFSERNPERLIQAALEVIPENSEYARVVSAVLEFYRKHPEDWHAVYRFIFENFGYDRYPGPVHIIPNAGVVVMGLLYGEGDFSRSIQITNMAGWDTDCNVGNVGAIMGVAVGLEGIGERWRAPVNDILVTASIIGTRNLSNIPSCADLMVDLGRKIAGEAPQPRRPRQHFEYPGSTHGFRHMGADPKTRGRVLILGQQVVDGTGTLKAVVRKLHKKGEIRLFMETYYRPERLSANYYGATFSPKIYPGQDMRARVYLPQDASTQLRASLYVWDSNHEEKHQEPGVPLIPGQWHDLSYKIPAMRGVCLSEAGIVLRNLGEPWTGPIFLDYLDWDGTPNFSFDFSKERNEQGAISQWTFLRGYWRLWDDAYHGSGPGVNETYTGDVEWQDYTLCVRLTPILGVHHNVLVRVQGALRSYALGLSPGDELVLYKNKRGYQPVARAAFAWEHGQSYKLNFKVKDNHVTAWITDGPRLEWVDENRPYLNGQIGLSNFASCHTRFEEVSVSP